MAEAFGLRKPKISAHHYSGNYLKKKAGAYMDAAERWTMLRSVACSTTVRRSSDLIHCSSEISRTAGQSNPTG